MEGNNSTAPWFDGKGVDEVSFCKSFLADHPMVCMRGTFFTIDKRVSDERELKKEIYEMLKPVIKAGVAKKVDNLLEVLRSEAYVDDLPIETDRIHVANGTLSLDGTFALSKVFCRNRLPVVYDPNARPPNRWLSFLDDLLDAEDIPTLQEYMGYCLIPTTKAQKMLMLIGRGGEGKSRIGVVMRSLLGENAVNGSINKVETNRFARADLEHALVMIDDDMKTEGLPQTNYIKSLITAELPMDLERKCQQSYQAELYVRFLGFGNGSLKALYDRSDGFFRRQIILTTKPRNSNRVDDPNLSEKLIAERDGIFLWCLEGLRRLIANDYRFSISSKAKENIDSAVSDGNNLVDFMASEGYIRLKADGEISTKDLYAAYKLWCEDNSFHPLSERSVSLFLHENEKVYNLEATNNIYIGSGRRVRGFLGIESLI